MAASKDNIWVDGCFDFTHHGHAGAMMQARQLGKSLVVGVHTDEEIAHNKGPTVMSLAERLLACRQTKWCTDVVPGSPYVTALDWLDRFNCWYVVHGDDISTDANGQDCYQLCKDVGRFQVVKRTPGVSTTDLIGRILDSRRVAHHIVDVRGAVENDRATFTNYATDETGHSVVGSVAVYDNGVVDVIGSVPSNCVYVNGAFDLYHPGHISFLRKIKEKYPSHKIIVGVLSDTAVNGIKGKNYPIMSVKERSLCVLASRYVDGVVLAVNTEYVPEGAVLVKSHDFGGPGEDIGEYEYSDFHTQTILDRIEARRIEYEARQANKGEKALLEEEMATI